MTAGLRIDVELPRVRKLGRMRAPLAVDNAEARPYRVDQRGECLRSSNQGPTSQCAAYALAGAIELRRRQRLDICEQIDPAPLYADAKTFDGLPGDGTTLEAIIRAGERAGWYAAHPALTTVETWRDAKLALMRHRFVLCGFDADDGLNHTRDDGWWIALPETYGGHAMLAIGIADDHEHWLAVQNSWGEGHGWNGFVRMSPITFDKRFMYGVSFDLEPLK